MDDTVAELRALLDQHRPQRNPEGFPPQVRARITPWIRARRQAGARWSELGDALGLSHTTVRNWANAQASTSEPTFLPVRLAPAAPLPAPAASAPTPVLVTPRGYRVEGLSIENLGELLGRLG